MSVCACLQMRGSATSLMKDGPYAALSDLFFVVAFARDCTGKYNVHQRVDCSRANTIPQ